MQEENQNDVPELESAVPPQGEDVQNLFDPGDPLPDPAIPLTPEFEKAANLEASAGLGQTAKTSHGLGCPNGGDPSKCLSCSGVLTYTGCIRLIVGLDWTDGETDNPPNTDECMILLDILNKPERDAIQYTIGTDGNDTMDDAAAAKKMGTQSGKVRAHIVAANAKMKKALKVVRRDNEQRKAEAEASHQRLEAMMGGLGKLVDNMKELPVPANAAGKIGDYLGAGSPLAGFDAARQWTGRGAAPPWTSKPEVPPCPPAPHAAVGSVSSTDSLGSEHV